MLVLTGYAGCCLLAGYGNNLYGLVYLLDRRLRCSCFAMMFVVLGGLGGCCHLNYGWIGSPVVMSNYFRYSSLGYLRHQSACLCRSFGPALIVQRSIFRGLLV